jgi:hypothetical protein
VFVQGVIKFIWLAIFLSIVAFIFPVFRDHYLLGQYGVNEIPYQVTKQWEFISYFFVALKNIAAASWLFWLALKDNVNKLAWVVFGLFFGLIAVALYYLVRINGKVET